MYLFIYLLIEYKRVKCLFLFSSLLCRYFVTFQNKRPLLEVHTNEKRYRSGVQRSIDFNYY